MKWFYHEIILQLLIANIVQKLGFISNNHLLSSSKIWIHHNPLFFLGNQAQKIRLQMGFKMRHWHAQFSLDTMITWCSAISCYCKWLASNDYRIKNIIINFRIQWSKHDIIDPLHSWRTRLLNISEWSVYVTLNINGLGQAWSNTIANTLELLQLCTKPSISNKVLSKKHQQYAF